MKSPIRVAVTGAAGNIGYAFHNFQYSMLAIVVQNC